MKKSALLLCSFFIVSCVYAQSAYLFDATATNKISTLGKANNHYAPPVLTKNNTVNIEEAFFGNGWHQGYVIVNNSKKSNVTMLLYSMHTNDLSFIENEKKYTVPVKLLDGFIFTGPETIATFKNGFHSQKYGITVDQMMRVIYDGDMQLLAKETSAWDLRPGGPSGQKRYQFFPKTTFFLVKDGDFHKIKLRKRDILKELNKNRQKIKSYAESNGLTFKKEADLTKILSHFDTI